MNFVLPAGAVILACALLALPAHAADSAKADLKDAKGNSLGTVQLTPTPAGVLLTAEFKGLPEGVHGFHIHGVGKCEPPFESAGKHFNPGEAKHGFMAEGGPHAGDMPNLHVPASGELKLEILNPWISLAEGKNSVLDEDGSVLIVHADPDDYKSDPAGHAGDRLACGVIE
jgi:Cu-Zn family superoxide dismutase